MLLLLCITVFLSYLPEAGEYAFVFLYVEQVRRAFATVASIG